MPKTMALLAVLALAGGTTARAEQATPAEDEEAVVSPVSSEEPAAPRRMIRVLQHPYDLASFYRSSPDGWRSTRGGVPMDPAYALASFYRSDRSGPMMPPWAPFWASGYAARPAGYLGYRHSIGENGELFLAVPFLAPVGPLSGAFFGY